MKVRGWSSDWEEVSDLGGDVFIRAFGNHYLNVSGVAGSSL